MRADVQTLRDLLEGKEHYEIPVFQRPYVWNEEDQWVPLWEDVKRIATASVQEALTGEPNPTPHHFLGAVVYESKPPPAGGVVRHDVIDGQQRMTTLQLLAKAALDVVNGLGFEDEAESLQSLVRNHQAKFQKTQERFKLWPLPNDRQAFESVMDSRTDWSGGTHQIRDAFAFFESEVASWIGGQADEDGVLPPGDEANRAEALISTIEDRLLLVAIDLTGEDDPQLIFESLNDRGTPLLNADLIKNWVFRRGADLGNDVERWAHTDWADFDGDWWREEISVGRQKKSRIDVFLQYWLTMRTTSEVKADLVFQEFVNYAKTLMVDAAAAESLLAALRADAMTYRDLSNLAGGQVGSSFYDRVIGAMELSVTTPVLLWMLSTNHSWDESEIRDGLDALESWVVRRTLLRGTTKDLNRFIVAILRELSSVTDGRPGKALRSYLSSQTADTRVWPSDDTFKSDFPSVKVYYNIKQPRIKAVLRAVEGHLLAQSRKHEAVPVPQGLDVEHIMPRRWRTYWDSEPPLDSERASQRDAIVDTIGNLTLVTKSLNSALSNRPWLDRSAEFLREGGYQGRGKRSLLAESSVLLLNKRVVDDTVVAWTEADIQRRAQWLAETICEVWIGPDQAIQALAIEHAREQ